MNEHTFIFTARRYASAVCVVVCACVRVYLSHAGIVSRRINVGSRKRHTIAQNSSFLMPNSSVKIKRVISNWTPNAGEVG